MAEIVERYLDAIASRDWGALRDCVAEDVVRIGPFMDRYEGRGAYVAFIADTMPKLRGYEMRVERVTYAGNTLAFAELSETVEMDGKPVRTPEALVFELDGDGRIARIEVFIQTRLPSGA
ncbi:MAG: nuclear transport factor 2 family protein [Actinobacteria bacterium]|nr:nuclear transport factor 2 family protein [Actinomycetota bacterium]